MIAKIKKYSQLLLFSAFIWTTWGCNSVRYLNQDEYLLTKSVGIQHDGDIKKNVLYSAIRTKPNRKLLVSRSFLHLYNFGRGMVDDTTLFRRVVIQVPKAEEVYNKTANWLINGIGEPPVIVKKADIQRDSTSLYNACFAHGFLYPQISYQIDTLERIWSSQRASITFHVNEGKPYVIKQVLYDFEDPNLLAAYDLQNTGLIVGENYNHNLLTKERARVTSALRNSGYFTFSQNLLRFEVDTAFQALEIEESLDHIPISIRVIVDEIPPRYYINNILVSLKAPSDAINLENAFKDTIRANRLTPERRELLDLTQKQLHDSLDITFVVTATIIKKLNYNFISKRIHLKEGALYSLEDARLTQRRLQELGMFQFAILNYEIVDSTSLDIKIDMQMAAHYQIKMGVEAFSEDITTSTNLPSIGANLTLRNKNVFGRSERLDWNIGGNIGFYAADRDNSQFEQIFYELGSSLNLNFPTLLIPFIKPKNEGQFSPTTTFTSSIRQENLREYERLTTGINLSYKWNHDPFKRNTFSQLTPLAIDFISINLEKDPAFRETVSKLPFTIQRDYESRFSSRLSYSFTHSSDYLNYKANYFLRLNFEVGGTLPRIIDELTSKGAEGNDNRLFDDFFYAQYVKASAEGKYIKPLGEHSVWITRGIFGFSRAYGNTKTVPQESRFFSGGTNSMRGWQSNTLGPGTLALEEILDNSTTNTSLAAPGGEILMEINSELRFDLISYLEMAIFTDLGNVWFNPRSRQSDENSEGDGIPEAGIFSRENFKLGWDAGIGFRFDFSFLILRLDIGQQLYAPDRGWILNQLVDQPDLRSTQFNLGIGYPF